MTGRVDPAETLAYVDDCLDPEARSNFEARLKADPELRREVARWEAQNRDIRAAFGAPPRSALDLGGVSNENGVRRAGEAARPAGRRGATVRPGAQAARGDASGRQGAARRPGLKARRLAGVVALAAAIVWVGLPSLGPQPSAGAGCGRRVGRAALADLPVEFVAGDPAALAARLGPRLALTPPLAPGLRLVGARLAPGSQATATLYIYENSRGERVALMVEPLDESVAAAAGRGEADGFSVAAWTGAGYGFVAAARQDADVAALVAAAGADDAFLADAGLQRR